MHSPACRSLGSRSTLASDGPCWGGRHEGDGRGRATQENAEAVLRVSLDLDNHWEFVLIAVGCLEREVFCFTFLSQPS